ncbi:MAG: tetratricopeptide repeat protein [Planctomycetota bacterium]|jgi:tetratricopeptide (TPR) repeat protein
MMKLGLILNPIPLLLIGMLLFPPGFAEAEEAEYTQKSKRFEVGSDVSQEFSDEIAEYMEGLWEQFQKIFKWKMRTGKYRHRVRFFKKKDDFDKLAQGKLRYKEIVYEYAYTHFWRESEENILVGYVLDKNVMLSRLRRQAFWQYIQHFIEHPPRWLAEGLACYFGECAFDPEKGFTCDVPRGFIREWREGILGLDPGIMRGKVKYISILDIIRLPKKEWKPIETAATYESWGICRYFMAGGDKKLRKKFQAYCRCLRPDASADENTGTAFQRAFSRIKFHEFEKTFLTYMRNLKPLGLSDFVKGFAHFEKKEHEEAIACFSSAIQADPENYRYHYFRAICLLPIAKLDEALRDCETAIRLFPESSSSYLQKGKVYYYKKDFDKAREVIAVAVKLNPEYETEAKEWLEKMKEGK